MISNLEDVPKTENIKLHISRLFPPAYTFEWWKRIQLTRESLTSITPHRVAKTITIQIVKTYIKIYTRMPKIIVDATANVGGNAISFLQTFDTLIAYEVKTKTSRMLEHNLKLYGGAVVHNVDFNKHIKDVKKYNADIVFIDPPWFLEEMENITLTLNYKKQIYMIPIEETLLRIWEMNPNIMIAIKVPHKHKLKINETECLVFRKMDILVFTK